MLAPSAFNLELHGARAIHNGTCSGATRVSKKSEGYQLNMADLWNPRLRSVKELRARRRAAGFVERTHFIPVEYSDEFRIFAEELRKKCEREYK